jgi:hypothetical protein
MASGIIFLLEIEFNFSIFIICVLLELSGGYFNFILGYIEMIELFIPA